MSYQSAVDTQASDRGLASCFRAARVGETWSEAFVKQHKLETLEDFIYVVDRTRREASLSELTDEVAVLKGDRLALARLKAAYEAGYSAIQKAQAVDKSEPNDLDQPIPEKHFQQLIRSGAGLTAFRSRPTLIRRMHCEAACGGSSEDGP